MSRNEARNRRPQLQSGVEKRSTRARLNMMLAVAGDWRILFAVA